MGTRTILFLTVWISIGIRGEATSLRIMGLGELVTHADRIVLATCTGVSRGVDRHGLPHTSYQMQVLEGIKGRLPSTSLTLKQFGLTGDSPSRRKAAIPGMPDYQPGVTYLLLLNPESELGFSSPVGLMQGAFRIGGLGLDRVAVNEIANQNLLAGAAPAGTPAPLRGPVSYRALVAAIRQLMSGPLSGQELARILGEERQ